MTARTRTRMAVIIAIVSAGCSSGDGRTTTEGGPIADTSPHGWAITKPVGSTFTDGLETLRLRGERPAVIQSVELLGDDGLELIGFSLVGPEREVSLQVMHSYPPRHPELDPELVVPGEGATIRPGDSWELLVGMRVTKPGYLVRDSVRIHYTVDGINYTHTRPAELAVCTSARMEVDGHCPFRDER